MRNRFDTKDLYLKELKRTLSAKRETLASAEVEEILHDTEAHFNEGLEHGKTESEIAKRLGDPKALGEGYLAQAMIRPEPRTHTISSGSLVLFRVLKTIFILAPANFFFAFGPLVLLTLTTFLGWILAFAVGVVGAVILIEAPSMREVQVPDPFSLQMAFVFACFTLIFASLTLGLAMWKVTEAVFRLLWTWIRWNMKFVFSA